MTTRRRRIGSESEKIQNENSYLNRTYGEIENATMSRDRTVEFSKAVRNLKERQIIRAVATQDPNRARNLQSYGHFMMLARTIGKDISSTYAKLEKLTLLAKRKPLFNDQPTEIQELTYIIKEDLNSLNSQIARLQEVIKTQNETRNKKNTQHLISHSSSVVLALQSKLASMSSQFKQVLEVRTENLKEAKKRRDHFSQGPVSSVPQSFGSNEGSFLLAQENSVAIDMDGLSQQQMQMVSYDSTDQYVTQRAETMQNIESTIVELGAIFQQLAHMVKEQEEMVNRIDTNVHDAELNVESAHREILKYFQTVSSNRWLMVKVCGVLLFFVMFFLIFMT